MNEEENMRMRGLIGERDSLVAQLHALKEAIKPCFNVDMRLYQYLGNSTEGINLRKLYEKLPIECPRCKKLVDRVLFFSDVIKHCDAISDTVLLTGARGPTPAEIASGKAEDIDPLAFLNAE